MECVNDKSKSAHIRNCKELKSLSIGLHAFDEYAGGFELLNLPKLESIWFGITYPYGRTFNFCYSDFSLRSTQRIVFSLLIDLPKLETIHFSYNSFLYSHSIVFESILFIFS